MDTSSEYIKLLQDKGVSSSIIGARYIGLRTADALRAVDILRKDGSVILGGDVYFQRDDRIELAYANWHTDARPDETRDAYARRSCEATKEYILTFPKTSNAEPIFAFVTK